MTRTPEAREKVEAPKRRPMTKARKVRIWTARNGLCGECGEPVPMLGKGVRYDHRGVLWITLDDSDDAIWPIHAACDARKTPGDISTVAKIKRLIRDADPETRKRAKRAIPAGRPLQGRGFDKSRSKGFDRVVRERGARA
jgi:hypothetical protein